MSSPKAAPALFASNRPFLFEKIARHHGLVQYQIEVDWAEDRFRAAPEIAPLFSAASVDPAALVKAVERLAERLGPEFEGLLPPAVDLLALPRVAGMLWNVAALVPARSEVLLDAALAQIDAIWTEGLTLRVTGPAPMMSFSRSRSIRSRRRRWPRRSTASVSPPWTRSRASPRPAADCSMRLPPMERSGTRSITRPA